MVKMKYRLIFLLLLPFIVTLFFVIRFLYENYQSLRAVNEIIEFSHLSDTISRLGTAVQQEFTFSTIYLKTGKKAYDQELQEARTKTDEDLATLKNLVKESPLQRGELTNELGELFKEFEGLNQKRNLIDTTYPSLDEISNYFTQLREALLTNITHLSDVGTYRQDPQFMRTLFSQINLIHLRTEVNKEKRIVFLSLLDEKKISKEDFILFLQCLGKQMAFVQSYQELATPKQERIFHHLMKHSVLEEVHKMEKEIIQSGPNVPLTIDPHTWWQGLTEKSSLIQTVEMTILEEDLEASENYRNQLLRDIHITIAIIILALGLALYFLFLTLRTIASKLQEEIAIINASVQEILAAVHEASSGTAETATAVTETTTTMEELKQTAQVAAEKADHVSHASDHALTVLKESERSIDETIQGMNRIQEGMGTITQSILKLTENSKAIATIIDSVNDLAEQSHLLAVNAAIEAAKAGDQGKGFSVVAQEMRSLAEQSKQATVQVRKILNDIQMSTSAAVMATEQGSKAVGGGMTQSAQTNQSIRSLSIELSKVVQAASQIAISNQQQLIGVEQVTTAMENIKEASSQQVEHMHEVERGIRDLNEVAQNLKILAQDYQL